MNKHDITENLSKFPYSKDDYWIITGAAMVLYGIKESTSDIDMGCTTSMANHLEQAGYFYKITEAGRRCFKVGDCIEIFENWINDTVTEVDGIPVISIQGLLEMKKELGREKDIEDIIKIQEYTEKVSTV